MSDYSKITNFLSKDSLALNDPAKYVKGSELDAEYNAIAVAIATKANSDSPTITGTITAAIANFSGLVTAALGLTVSGAAFNSRGITDNATAKALTLSGSGANSVTIANSATNPTIGTTAGQLILGAAGTAVVNISGGSQTVGISSAGAGITTQLSINKTAVALSGTYPYMLDLNHAAFAGGNAFGIAWRSSSRYDWIGQLTTSGRLGCVVNISGTPINVWVADNSGNLSLGGDQGAESLRIVPVSGSTRWITATGSAAGNPIIGVSGGHLVLGGAALATNATVGFPCIPTCAGTPTGVPANITTGTLPFIYDSTNNLLYVYNGGWKKSTAYAA